MNKRRIKGFLVLSLMMLEFVFLSLTFSAYLNKDVVPIKEENKINNRQFAIFIKNVGDTNYTEYLGSNEFPTGYKVNLDKSECWNSDGPVSTDIISQQGKNIVVTSNKTVFCNIYFDEGYKLSQLCSSQADLGECLIVNNNRIDNLDNTSYSGLYRYTGINEGVNDNYICFGTNNVNECLNNQDKYMYRIIGVTSESNNSLGLDRAQVKLVKNVTIKNNDTLCNENGCSWDTYYNREVIWTESDINEYLNGSGFLNNTNYLLGEWVSLIDSVNWNIGNVEVDFSNNNTVTVNDVYNLEAQSKTPNTSKIGLLNLSDYFYAYKSGGSINSNKNWLSENFLGWLITRYGMKDTQNGYYSVWHVQVDGNLEVKGADANQTKALRPVFYLNTDVKYLSGDGTTTNPIILFIGDAS